METETRWIGRRQNQKDLLREPTIVPSLSNCCGRTQSKVKDYQLDFFNLSSRRSAPQDSRQRTTRRRTSWQPISSRGSPSRPVVIGILLVTFAIKALIPGDAVTPCIKVS